MIDLLGIIRTAFDGDDVAAKNRALRKAHDEIKRLSEFVPSHEHRKGGKYVFVGYAKVQTDTPLSDYDHVVVYRAEDSTLWVRPTAEFHDGRFRALPK